MSESGKILIVDDEKDIVEILAYNLEKAGYTIETAYDGVEGLEKAEKFLPDLILLDIMMPQMDGMELCQKLREERQFDGTLIAFLTAIGESFTQVSALDSGGDDFITKPVKPNVLLSRVRALLRRHAGTKKVSSLLEFEELKIDLESFSVHLNNQNIPIAKKEFELLALLVSKPGKVFKREEIMRKVWGNEVIVGDRTIDVHIRKLREKIGSNYIHTMKGVGYKFIF